MTERGANDAVTAMRRGQRRVLIPMRVPPPPPLHLLRQLTVKELAGETMGTTWSARLALAPGRDLVPIERTIHTVLARVIREMSPWEPTAHITYFNQAAAGTWHRLPGGFFDVLSAALAWAEKSGGAYDPTIGAAVALWGFGPEPQPMSRPDPEATRAARARSGWHRVSLDRETRSAFQPGGVALDLCSIAKGFAVDEIVRALQAEGLANLLVEIGGELRGEGVKPDGTPWWVAFERPRRADAKDSLPATILALAGLSVATSGDARRYFEVDGRRYSHTLDPRTGEPVAHGLVSVTVAATSCMEADAAATALTVLGPVDGPAFATAHALAARFVHVDGGRVSETLSPAMAAMLG